MDTPEKNTPLTPKQLHFCRCVASGATQADAYRESYDVGPDTKASTCQQAGSRLMRKAQIRARVERLIEERERAIAVSAVSDREKVLTKLRQWVDPERTPDGEKELASASELKAAELLGRSVGLFRDVVEDGRKRTAGEVEGEIERRLLDLLGDDSNEDAPDLSDEMDSSATQH